MKRSYKILEWCLLPSDCGNPSLTITIDVDDFLTPDLQRGYISGVKGMIRDTDSIHDYKTYTFIFDKILFKETAYIGTIVSQTKIEIPEKNGIVDFEIPIMPLNYFF
jgi:hypothetical protein